MTTRRLVRAARVANATLDGWLTDAAVEVVDGRIASVGARRRPAVGHRHRPTRSTTSATCRCCRASSRRTSTCTFPAAPDYREIARPEPVERSIIRATDAMRRLLLSGATTARDTGSPGGRGAGDPVGRARRRHPRPAPARRRGADHHDRRPLLVPRRRGRHDRGGPRARARAEEGRGRRDQGDGVGRRLHADLQPALRAVRRSRPCAPPSPRRTGWVCPSWPTR